MGLGHHHSPNRPQGSHSVLPGCYLSDEVPADLRLLVEERQDVIQEVPYQWGLVVHGWVEKSQSGPAHVQVWVLQALHELSWQKNERGGVKDGTAKTQTTSTSTSTSVIWFMRVMQTWLNVGEHVLSFVPCTASLQSPEENVNLSLAWVQIQVLPLSNSGTLESLNVLIC